MLLEAKIVHVPAQRERDADLAEYGCLATTTRAGFGAAAVEAGTPDFGQNDAETDAVDAIANILHWIDQCVIPVGSDRVRPIDDVMRQAREHFDAEIAA